MVRNHHTATASCLGDYGHVMQRLLPVFAALTLIPMLAALIVFWPIPYLGIAIDAPSGIILGVDPGSAADRAGILPGDRVIRIYDYAWQDADRQLILFPLAWQTVTTIPVQIARDGIVTPYLLPANPPDSAYQLEKLAAFGLGLICWLVGYRIGIVQRHDPTGTPIVAWFWMGLGALVGCYTFGLYSSYPLSLALRWLLLSVIAPVSVFLHVWFPVRSVTQETAHRARQWLIGSMLTMQIVFISGIIVFQPTVRMLIDLLSVLTPIGLTVAFLASGVVLRQSYARTTVAHVRRQIRLLGSACLVIAGSWLGLRAIPLLLHIPPVLPEYGIDLISGLLPLAYLVGSVTPDLYRVDRIMLRLAQHALTGLILIGLLLVVTSVIRLSPPVQAAWLAVCIVVLYRPLLALVRRLPPFRAQTLSSYQPLALAASQVARTLDPQPLVDAVVGGIQATFDRPPLGFYLQTVPTGDTLTICMRDRLDVPERLPAGIFTEYLTNCPTVIDQRTLHARLQAYAPDDPTMALLQHPAIVLWCPLHHVQGHLLGVLALGMRGDLDPYRADDLRELGRLLETAALAFTNSAAYREQRHSEQTIRRLLQRVQQVQDSTAAAIAREIHDEVININLRLNMEAIRQLIADTTDPALQTQLTSLLESEQTLVGILRYLCERLHPWTDDDPFGLPTMLRQQVDRIAGQWPGACRLVLQHDPQPIAIATQWEAFRITREALNNAIKHAAATEIIIELIYPATGNGTVQLIIRDNGRGMQHNHIHSDGLGIRNMIESARAIGGQLAFQPVAGGGTAIVFTFAVMAAAGQGHTIRATE